MKTITNDAEFKGAIASGIVLADFFAAWCGPCRMLAPLLGELATEMPNVSFIKLDIDDVPESAQDASVRALPTLVLYKDGIEKARLMGYKPKSELKAWIEENAK